MNRYPADQAHLAESRQGRICEFCLAISGVREVEVVAKNYLWFAYRLDRPNGDDGERFVVVPKKHVTELEHADPIVLGQMVKIGGRIARSHGLGRSGYRVSLNIPPFNPETDNPEQQEHLHLVVERT